MFYFLYMLACLFYRGYKKTKFEEDEQLLSQPRMLFTAFISVLSGMFINYLLADNWPFYASSLNENTLLFAILPLIYMYMIAVLVWRKYTDKRLLKIDVEYSGKISISFAKLLLVFFFIVFISTVYALFMYTVDAFSKN